MNIRSGIENSPQVVGTQAPQGTKVTSSPVKSVIAEPSSESLAKDTTRLSSAATEVAQSANNSDVRLDKVASIRSQLDAGTYAVSSQDVAKKVIESITSS